MRSSLSQESLAKNGIRGNVELCCSCKDKKKMASQGTRRGPLSPPCKEPDPQNAGRPMAQGKRLAKQDQASQTHQHLKMQENQGRTRARLLLPVPPPNHNGPPQSSTILTPRDRPRPPCDCSHSPRPRAARSNHPSPTEVWTAQLGTRQFEILQIDFLIADILSKPIWSNRRLPDWVLVRSS